MKAVGFMILHYGAEYLRWAIRSVGPHVDSFHIHYSPNPCCSHRPAPGVVNPETRTMLREQAYEGAVDAGRHSSWLTWHDSPDRLYGEHSDFAVETAKGDGAEIVFNLDADEVWDGNVLAEALRHVEERRGAARHWRVPFRHFWRSLHQVCQDSMMPQRFIDLSVLKHDAFAGMPLDVPVMHFGYAQSPRVVQYKTQIHNHKLEFRSTRWFEEIFVVWPSVDDVHPTCEGIWNPRAPDPALERAVERVLYDHPYHGVPCIEESWLESSS